MSQPAPPIEIKKRGRKPKGGKMVVELAKPPVFSEYKLNIILHLKCHISDLDGTYNTLDNYHEPPLFQKSDQEDDNMVSKQQELKHEKELWKKIKSLDFVLKTEKFTTNRCACFWDSCSFDNPPIYIPRHYLNEQYQVYGCFCSPECAVAYLMREPIDTSTKFERYQLLNHLYSGIFNYTTTIKPAPDPHYMLDKFYGNLTVQDYRALLRNDRFFVILDKPISKIMPELHEDNDNFIVHNRVGLPNMCRRRSQEPPKNSVLDRFIA